MLAHTVASMALLVEVYKPTVIARYEIPPVSKVQLNVPP